MTQKHQHINSIYLTDLKNVYQQLYLLGLGEIGRLTNYHFVEEDAQKIPVHTLAMACFTDHFRGEVGNRATEGLCTA